MVNSSGYSNCTCGSQFYPELISPCTDNSCLTCLPCDPNCNGCIGPSSSNCTSCATMQYETDCVSSCPPNTWISSYNQYICVNSCNTTEYGNTTTRVCSSCDPSCLTCFGGFINNCITCLPGYFFYLNQCFAICPNGVWGDSTNFTCIASCGLNYYGDPIDRVCKLCDLSCKTCSGDGPNNCTKCVSNLVLYKGSCVMQCPSLYYEAISNNICVSDCGLGNYGDPLSGKCKTCDTSCLTCIGGTSYNCSTCNSPLLYEYGECVSQCSKGYFLSQMSGTCLKCDSSCLNCKGPTNSDCLNCSDPTKYLSNNICVDECINPLFERDDTKTCESCNANNCLECNIKWNICKICAENYLLNKFQICQEKLKVYCNLNKIGETNNFNLTCDQNINLATAEMNSFISLNLETLYFTKTGLTYQIELLNNKTFFLNFSFSSNLTEEVEFLLQINETFITSKYSNYNFIETNFTNILTPTIVCPSPYMLIGNFYLNI